MRDDYYKDYSYKEMIYVLAIKGYYDGKNFVPIGNVKIEKNKVAIITILDEYMEQKDALAMKLDAIDKISGLLQDEGKDIISEFEKVVSKRMNMLREVDL